jgi:hypothetical protein
MVANMNGIYARHSTIENIQCEQTYKLTKMKLCTQFFYCFYFIRLPYTTRPSNFCERVNFNRRAFSFLSSGARSSINGMMSSGAHCFCSRKSCENRPAGSAGSSDSGKYEINQLFKDSPDDLNFGVLMYNP